MSTPQTRYLPKEVFLIKRAYHTATYLLPGRVSAALKQSKNWRRPGVRVYVAVITDRLADWPEGWVDVTDDFIDENGKAK